MLLNVHKFCLSLVLSYVYFRFFTYAQILTKENSCHDLCPNPCIKDIQAVEGALDGLGKDGWRILRRTLERWASELGEGVHRIEGNGLLLCGRLWSYKDRNAMGRRRRRIFFLIIMTE